MKKIALIALVLCFGLAMKAQENPNRMIVQPKSGNPKGFLIERIDSVYFTQITGRVAADITFKEFKTGDADTIILSVTKTPDCQAYRISCVPTVRANQWFTTDANVAAYFESTNETMYYDNFSNAEMRGFDFRFKPDSKYTLVTMGYDQYGIACNASRVDFTTPKAQLVGTPTVAWTIDEVKEKSFKITFTPNSDCKGYATCSFKKGEAQQQFDQWAPMMGFVNMGDMIKQFSGSVYTGNRTQEWTSMDPGTEYEVYVLPLDANDNYGEMVIVPVTTKKMGGEGTAMMTITLGEFGGDQSTGYYQYVTYTPNDQCGLHRDMIITKEAYNTAEWGENGVLNYLKSETNPYNPFDSYWNQYGEDVAQWGVDPTTEYIAFSIAQNANEEWGPLARKEFTTPEASTGAPRRVAVGERQQANPEVVFGKAPLNKGAQTSSGVRLEEK